MLVEQLQYRLQHQYDLAIPYQVEHFVSHDATLARQLAEGSLTTDSTPGSPARESAESIASETVFISQTDNSLEFTVYLDQDVVQSASGNAQTDVPGTSRNRSMPTLDSLCTVVEGVSHAVCLLWHAHHDRQLRALDLELQAEVDKYLVLLDFCLDEDSRSRLHRQLFANARFTAPVDSELYRRYKAASDSAATYCNWLFQEFPGPAGRTGLRQELARFYRLSGSAKFDRIKKLH
ncbi:MAG: hypothetical protein HKN42_12480 [Granulosicoccus sp.]|nr:hypothetical protein [Granulosicoccus sp.]